MTGPVRKLGWWMPVSREELVDAGVIPDPRPPVEVAAESARRYRERQEFRERYRVRHAELLGYQDAVVVEVARLHGPCPADAAPGAVLWCEGCEFDGAEAEAPEWPCRTWALVASMAR